MPSLKKRTTSATKRTKTKPKGGASSVKTALAAHGFPAAGGPGLCFRREDDDLYARGYPSMRFLTDERIPLDDAIKAAEKALDAIDPVFRIRVPRDIARVFLLGYRVGPLLFKDRTNAGARRAEREAAMRSNRAIDMALLEEVIEENGWRSSADTYARWRMPEVLYLFEGFLGPETVARAVTRHLVRTGADLRRVAQSADSGRRFDPYETNIAAISVAMALPPLLRRVPPAVASELRASLATLPSPDDAEKRAPRTYLGILRVIASPTAPPHPCTDLFKLDFALANDDAATLAAEMDRLPQNLTWHAGRALWLLGTSRLGGKLTIGCLDLALLVDEIAPMRDPGVVRLIAKIATQRAGKAAAAVWLRAHADYAAPILESLARVDDPKERSATAAAIELLDTSPAPEAQLTEEQVRAEVEKIFLALGDTLRAAKNRKAQVAAILDAYEGYVEVRAAGGDPTPEAYFTHCFGDFDLGQWAMLAVDCLS